MATVVIDANLAVGLVRQMAFSDSFRHKIELWFHAGIHVAVPGLWDYEVTTALRKLWVQGALTADEARAGLETLMCLGLDRYPADKRLLLSALRWSDQLGHSKAYDAQYVALAEQIGAELWTADQRLVNSLQALGVNWVHWISEV